MSHRGDGSSNGGFSVQQGSALGRKEPLVHVAEVVVGVDCRDVNGDVANCVRAVDDCDYVVGAKQTSELSDGKDDRGVGGDVADDAASDVKG